MNDTNHTKGCVCNFLNTDNQRITSHPETRFVQHLITITPQWIQSQRANNLSTKLYNCSMIQLHMLIF